MPAVPRSRGTGRALLHGFVTILETIPEGQRAAVTFRALTVFGISFAISIAAFLYGALNKVPLFQGVGFGGALSPVVLAFEPAPRIPVFCAVLAISAIVASPITPVIVAVSVIFATGLVLYFYERESTAT